MESVLTTTPPSRSARSSTSADLPLAVGPAIRIAFFTRPSPACLPEFSMPLIATLVSRPEDRAVSALLANMASRVVGASAVHWLAGDIACDLVLPGGPDIGEITATLRAALASEPVYIIVQPAEGRRKMILLADMDSTM